MADQTIKYNERGTGAGHPYLPDTLNRLPLVEHNADGTHKQDISAEHETDGKHKQINMTAGAGTAVAKGGGVIHIDLTQVVSTLLTEETLKTYTLPADSLNTVGQCIHIKAWGSTLNTALTKRIQVKFDGTTVIDSTAVVLNNKDWRLEGDIWLEGTTAQKASGVMQASANVNVVDTTISLAKDETTALDIILTVIAPTTGGGVTLEGFEISFKGGVE